MLPHLLLSATLGITGLLEKRKVLRSAARFQGIKPWQDSMHVLGHQLMHLEFTSPEKYLHHICVLFFLDNGWYISIFRPVEVQLQVFPCMMHDQYA